MTTLSRFAKKRAVDKELSILLKTSGQSSRIIQDNATQQLGNLVTRYWKIKTDVTHVITVFYISQLTRYCDRTVGEVCEPPAPAQLNHNSISTEDNDFSNLLSNSSFSETEKEIDILQELSLLYARKRLSLSALGEVAKLIKLLGHDIPIDPRTPG